MQAATVVQAAAVAHAPVAQPRVFRASVAADGVRTDRGAVAIDARDVRSAPGAARPATAVGTALVTCAGRDAERAAQERERPRRVCA